MKKVYIAGRISNYPEFKSHFYEVEDNLIDKYEVVVLNPAELPAGLTQQEYMSICIPMLNVCDTIVMLDGWESSVGANIEWKLANQLGMRVLYEGEL